MTRARDKASAVVANFASTGIDDNADATAITINSSEQVGIGTVSPSTPLHVVGANGILVDTEGNGDGSIYFGGISGTDRTYLARSSDDFLIYNVSNGPMRFGTNNTERMRILAAGGITFNGDTAAANALDDYEEGTWDNFTIVGGTTFTNVTTSYTKIGQMVFVICQVLVNTNTDSSNLMQITGLPYTVAAGDGAGSLAYSNATLSDALSIQLQGTSVYFYGSGGSNLTPSTFSYKHLRFAALYKHA